MSIERFRKELMRIENINMKFAFNILSVLVSGLIIIPNAAAYVETHPPYSFKEKPYKFLNAKPIEDSDHLQYRSSGGKVLASVKKSAEGEFWDFLLQDETSVLAKRHIDYAPVPFEIYYVDVNGDGLKDFIILMTYRAMGMSSLHERVEIFLKKKEGGYRQIAYDVVDVSIKDFVDLNNNGKYEVIITGFYEQGGSKQDSSTHNYFSYNVYEFNGYRLQNADKKYKGFPKFVWFTDKPNDKDSNKVSPRERWAHVLQKEKGIVYKDIK